MLNVTLCLLNWIGLKLWIFLDLMLMLNVTIITDTSFGVRVGVE